MSRTAKTVCTQPDEIDRITRLVTEMPTGEVVRIVERNGQIFTGTVVERPCVQLFEDGRGVEGINAVVRIDDPSAPPWSVELWLSDIEAVETLQT